MSDRRKRLNELRKISESRFLDHAELREVFDLAYALTEERPESDLLKRPYAPPPLYIYEEVEIGGGYHTLQVSHLGKEADWSKPYRKSSQSTYRSRTVRVPYPPSNQGDRWLSPERSDASNELTRLETGILETFDTDYVEELEDKGVTPVDVAFQIFERLRFAEAELERRDRSVTGTTFEEVWKGKEAQGYRYGSDALESVRFGWELAVAAIAAERDKEPK